MPIRLLRQACGHSGVEARSRGYTAYLVFDRIVCGAGSMKRSSVRLSVCLSHRSPTATAAACGGFVAESPAGRRFRSTGRARCGRRAGAASAGAQQQQRCRTALSSKYGQCRVDSRGSRLSADLFVNMASRFNIYSQLVILAIRIVDINNLK